MQESMNLRLKLDNIQEAKLTPERIALVDQLISKLERLKEMDFGPGGDAGKSHFISRVYEESVKINYAMQYGKSDEDLARIQAAAVQRTDNEKRRKDSFKKQKSIIEQFAEQYPRLINSKTNDFDLVQPNGDFLEFKYPVKTDSFVSLINAFRQLYKSGAYKTAAENVEKLRDYGLNISSKILSTLFSSFRTRYSVISDVILSYDGPMVVGDEARGFKIANKYVPGRCHVKGINIQQSNASGGTLNLENVTLDHIGEIIDTIDTLIRAINNVAVIKEIRCMGDDVIEYEVTTDKISVTIPSSQINTVHGTARLLFDTIKAKGAQ